MPTVVWVIVGLFVLALLFLGAARASSASMGSDVRQGASNGRPVAVAQAEVASSGASAARYAFSRDERARR